jgi:hypothetical protein
MKILSSILICALLLTSIGIVVGGKIGIELNGQKIQNIDSNPIYIELNEKVKSGELKVDEELGLILVQGMRDAHVDVGNYLISIFDIFIYVGCFLILLVVLLVFVTWRLYGQLAMVSSKIKA